jgi:alpha-1,3-rhamnosyl/mannosyltransferase
MNDRVLLLQRTGVGHYVQQLLSHLGKVEATACVRGFFSSWSPRLLAPTPDVTANSRATESIATAGSRPTRRAWLRSTLQTGYALAFRARSLRYDLVHEPNHVPIATGRTTITTIHDLSVLAHPEWHPADRVRWYERGFAQGVRRSARFIAASEFTKREMVRMLCVPPERIDVTYQAARPGFAPQPAERVADVRARFGLPERFFLFVGTLEPRKNLVGLLEAFAGLPRSVRAACPLAIAGGWGWNTTPLEEKLQAFDLRAEVRLLGYVHDAALAALYTGCAALAWPSLYEGFGLPPLEALSCGAPVIVSDAASLPEVVGEAGLLLNAAVLPEWTAALRRMVEDDAWRQEFRRRGPARAAQFSWPRCAAQTLQVYVRALSA